MNELIIARAINWISKIWQDLPAETTRKSFRVTGITSSNHYEYNSTLHHVMLHGKFPDAVVEDLPPDQSPDSGDSFFDEPSSQDEP